MGCEYSSRWRSIVSVQKAHFKGMPPSWHSSSPTVCIKCSCIFKLFPYSSFCASLKLLWVELISRSLRSYSVGLSGWWMLKPLPAKHQGSVELFKNAFSHVNFCSINPYDMSNIAIVSWTNCTTCPFLQICAQEQNCSTALASAFVS